MTPKRTALILWADPGSANLGVRALAAGTVDLLRSVWPDVECDYFERNDLSGRQPVRLSIKNLAWACVWPRHRICAWLGSYDVIIDTGGGDSFADIYGRRRMLFMSLLRLVAGRSASRLILGPQTIGPFSGPLTRWLARLSVRRAKLVLARDGTSVSYGERILKVRPERSTDVVFNLMPPESSGERFDIVLNVSGLLWNNDLQTDSFTYRAACEDLCRRLATEGRKVTLLPHVLLNESDDNDVVACEALAARIDGSVSVLEPADLEDVRSLLGSAELVIAARMHACLNAISVGVPAIAWAYSRKFAPLFGDLGWTSVIDVNAPDLVDQTVSTLQTLSDEGASMVAPIATQARARLRGARATLAAALA